MLALLTVSLFGIFAYVRGLLGRGDGLITGLAAPGLVRTTWHTMNASRLTRRGISTYAHLRALINDYDRPHKLLSPSGSGTVDQVNVYSLMIYATGRCEDADSKLCDRRPTTTSQIIQAKFATQEITMTRSCVGVKPSAPAIQPCAR